MRSFDPNYKVSKIRFLIGWIWDPSENNFDLFPIEFIESLSCREEDATIDPRKELEAGEYMAYIMINWEHEEEFSTFEFWTYSNQ